jgi:PAS domain S-box-containing protein
VRAEEPFTLDVERYTQSRLFRRAQQGARGAGALAVISSVLVLLGWRFDIYRLRSFFPGHMPVVPNSAIAFMLLGTAIYLTSLAPNRAGTLPRYALLARLAGLIAAAIGAVTLLEYLMGVDFGIDAPLTAGIPPPSFIQYPGRMSPLTALSLLLCGLAITFLHVAWPALRRASPSMALVAVLIAFITLLGYLYGTPALYRVANFPPISPSSALNVIALGLGIILVRPGHGFMAHLLSRLDGGQMARRLLPFAIALPVVIGWLRLIGQHNGLYGTEVGLAFFVCANVVIFSIIIMFSARYLNRADSERRKVTALSEGQKRVLEMIAQGAGLHETLEELVKLVDAQSTELACSILLFDAETRQLHHGAAARLPEAYCKAIDGEMIGPNAGSCGTAAYRGEPVFVSDIATDPLWVNYKHLALEHGLRACWSTPILDADGKVLGTFAIYYRQPGLPTKDHLRAVDIATYTAAICINRHRAEQDLRDNELRFRQITQSLPQLVWTCQPDGMCDYLSSQWVEYTGVPADRQLGFRWLEQIHPADRAPTLAAWKDAVANYTDFRIEFRIRRHDGSYRWFDTRAVRLRDQEGRVVKWFGSNTDITDRKQTEDLRIRSQKIEAMGTLAGGIAHDFNNILLAINGHTQVLDEELPPHHPARESITEIAKATARAADLVRRILSFSRQQESKHELISLPAVIDEALKLVRATLPAMIEIRADLPGNIPLVAADSTQIHQIIVNLATNAAYAIGTRGGLIEVRLNVLEIDADLAETMRDLTPGRYVRLVMADNGCGMDRTTLSRIFDPFFTTKPAGQGTGLGLSIVHGIMKSSKGTVTVYSQPDKGTSFHLYFPVADGKTLSAPAPAVKIPNAHGEHVMYVDDEEPLVRLAQRALTRLGYRVSGHVDPTEALEVFRAAPNDIDVLITDVSMPSMSGFDLTRAVLAIRPDLPVIMTSGYVRKEDEETAFQMGVREIILKPNTLEELGKALGKLFERRHAS